MRPLITILFCLMLHPVHVTVTGMEYDPGKNIINLFVKVYSDDMERDMKTGDSISGKSFEVCTEGFAQWLSDRIRIQADGHPLQLKLKEVTVDGLEHKFRLEAKSRRNATNISVYNTLHNRVYSDQSNMVMFKYNDVEEGIKMDCSDTIKVFRVK
jgi:hypothetical protein